jgi:hypothetical protein
MPGRLELCLGPLAILASQKQGKEDKEGRRYGDANCNPYSPKINSTGLLVTGQRAEKHEN